MIRYRRGRLNPGRGYSVRPLGNLRFREHATLRSACLTVLLLAAGTAVSAQTGEARAALATVETMFTAMRTRDTALLRSVFEPGARLVGIRTRGDGTTAFQAISVDQWVQFVGRDTRPQWIERAFDPKIEVNGTLAQIWAEYDFHFGTTFSHCGIDSVQLLRSNGRWLIVSIADTYQTTGCPTRPAPGDR